ncbi:glycolate oxidase subunit GlcE [Corticibacter populi]|uniref:Glycolate oxidase subunit GlcE n=1 Tax=Corticibacter populi TaxID=1550736 RepID=A0A3M6QTK7_9BURK|nr:glycolate oxidase subunit GlcE [Corticibacter populi]RMX06364.1 glycolate oxidase subunit GlcE [Corticibacter populi]RZS32092.1 glycolate oxidase FAD binding subunit [Corticibacter populi]
MNHAATLPSTLAAIPSQDRSRELLEQVQAAIASRTPLTIAGSGSKAFLGRQLQDARLQVLDVRGHRGIVSYDPTELIITARAGTPLTELQAALDAGGQMLACEAPHFGPGATVGGMVAAGLSGPRRPWAGAVRDFVLGTRLISGLGTQLRFGGEVMKNVAGYDVSRLLAGSLGCLGVITEVSFKVLPKPRCSVSVRQAIPLDRALARLREWGQQPLPISAASHDGDFLSLRFEGNEGSVRAAQERIGGEEIDPAWWDSLREQRLPFFDTAADAQPLWRLSVPAWAAPLDMPGTQLIDWGGAQRWLRSDAPADAIRTAAAAVGGHASCFTAGHAEVPLHPLTPAVLRLHQNLKKQLDPSGIFNPGRMYAEL